MYLVLQSADPNRFGGSAATSTTSKDKPIIINFSAIIEYYQK